MHHLRDAVIQLLLVVLAALVLPRMASATEPLGRALRVNDLLMLEGIGYKATSFSPNDDALAITRLRHRLSSAGNGYKMGELEAGPILLRVNDGGDIWVYADSERAPINVTAGADDGSSWFVPRWSPDGRHLAMLSTRGGRIGLWSWERATGQLRSLTSHEVNLETEVANNSFVWVDGTHILVSMMPPGGRVIPPLVAERPRQDQLTAVVLDTTEWAAPSANQNGPLILIDVTDGKQRVISQESATVFRLSPDGRVVASCKQIAVRPSDLVVHATERISASAERRCTVELHRLDGSELRLQGPLNASVFEKTLRWSPDSSELAFIAQGDLPGSTELWRIDARSTHVARYDLAGLHVSTDRLEWAGHYPLILADAHQASRPADAEPRRDWWLVQRNGTKRAVTRRMNQPPTELRAIAGTAGFIGTAEGDLWRIEPIEGTVKNITAKLSADIVYVHAPLDLGTEEPILAEGKVLVSARASSGACDLLIDIHSGEATQVNKPPATASPIALSTRTMSAIYHATDRTGMTIWRVSLSTGEQRALVAANRFLESVAESERQTIDYTGLNGAKLQGSLILPYGFVPGRRYPLLAWVYPGPDYRRPNWDSWAKPEIATLAAGTSGGVSQFLSMLIPAAAGYVVLIPSMPLVPIGEEDDPMLKLTDGVLPAVQKAVDLGIADPERLFVMGHSFGGYATYGLVTQTNRFKAAAALSGYSNLISSYGTFGSGRFTDASHRALERSLAIERKQARMGGPPWASLGRYLRNSPIVYVDRVTTPVLIIHGDLDHVPIQQAEEFFSALRRQQKATQYVRYGWEGHLLRNPCNVHDMWRRVFAWFDHFGDIARDDHGNMLFDGERAQSRNGAPPRRPADYATFDLFGLGQEKGHTADACQDASRH